MPPTGVTVALRLCSPSLNGVSGVKLQWPLASATAEPSRVLPSYTFTVPWAVALPFSVGVVSSVKPPLSMAPVIAPTSSITRSMLICSVTATPCCTSRSALKPECWYTS
ncbi:hypothetical protein D9M68_812650 [compost metagenome]